MYLSKLQFSILINHRVKPNTSTPNRLIQSYFLWQLTIKLVEASWEKSGYLSHYSPDLSLREVVDTIETLDFAKTYVNSFKTAVTSSVFNYFISGDDVHMKVNNNANNKYNRNIKYRYYWRFFSPKPKHNYIRKTNYIDSLNMKTFHVTWSVSSK